MWPGLLLLVILLVASAFFSGAETALFSLSRHERLRFSQDKHASRRRVAELLRRPRRLLLTLMIGNVTVNTFIFAASLMVFEQITGERSPWTPVLGLIAPVVVTLCGEILPKGTAIVLRASLAPKVAPIVWVVQGILSPFRMVLSVLLVEPATRLLTGAGRSAESVTAEELRRLITLSAERRLIGPEETSMLAHVVQLGELRVRDVMIPRVDMIAFDINADLGDLHLLLRKHRFTKLPVYDGDIDRLVGLLYAKDLLLKPDRPLRSMIRPVHFVPEMITLTQLTEEFRRVGGQIAAVVDEYGGLVGLVAIEDVARQIVGELADSDAPSDQPMLIALDEKRYRVAGSMSLHEWAERFGMPRPVHDAATVAGLMLERLGDIPRVGDTVEIESMRLRVESLAGRRIEWILLEVMEPPALGPDEEVSL